MFIFISYSYQIFISKLSSLENGLDGKRKTFYTYYIYTNVLVTSGNPQIREEGPDI